MKDKADELKARTKRFALRVLDLFRALPSTIDGREVGKQLLRSSMSVAANYRSICRARSRAEFIARMGVVVEEADEAEFWLEVVQEGRIAVSRQAADLCKEAGELLAIFAASQATARGVRNRQ